MKAAAKTLALSSFCLGLGFVYQAHAVSLVDLIGAQQTEISARFDRYEFNAETGDLQGPFSGALVVRRPGFLSLQEGETTVEIVENQLSYTPCKSCKPVQAPADSVLGKDWLELVRTGSNAGAGLVESETTQHDDGSQQTTYSLNGANPQLRVTLWSHKGTPTVLELSSKPTQKTILQLSGVRFGGIGNDGGKP